MAAAVAQVLQTGRCRCRAAPRHAIIIHILNMFTMTNMIDIITITKHTINCNNY